MLDARRRKQLTELFAEAAELAPAVHGAFIGQRCAHDPELARELTSLLRQMLRIDGFLAGPIELGPGEGPPPEAEHGA